MKLKILRTQQTWVCLSDFFSWMFDRSNKTAFHVSHFYTIILLKFINDMKWTQIVWSNCFFQIFPTSFKDIVSAFLSDFFINNTEWRPYFFWKSARYCMAMLNQYKQGQRLKILTMWNAINITVHSIFS